MTVLPVKTLLAFFLLDGEWSSLELFLACSYFFTKSEASVVINWSYLKMGAPSKQLPVQSQH